LAFLDARDGSRLKRARLPFVGSIVSLIQPHEAIRQRFFSGYCLPGSGICNLSRANLPRRFHSPATGLVADLAPVADLF
jgi:hypothetical protein